MKRILVFIASLTFSIFAFAESSGATQIVYSGGGNYSLVERTNLRRYDNGKYTGLLSREVRSFISRSDAPQGKAYIKGIWYDGSFYVTDLNSTNGVRLNGDLLTPGEAVPVGIEDRIEIGDREYSFGRA